MTKDRHHDEATTFLTFPTEIRIRIYTALFNRLILHPAWRDFGPGSLNTLMHQTYSPRVSLLILLGISSDFDHDLEPYQTVGDYTAQPPRYPPDLSILRTCRKIYAEAYPTLLRTAIFSLATAEDHLRLTQPHMLSRLRLIRRLSIASSILPEWPSTLIRLVSPAVSHFEIRDLQAHLTHEDMLHVDSLLPNSDGSPQNDAPLAATIIINLTQKLLMSASESGRLATILSHFITAADLYQSLLLHFQVECDWTGMMAHEHSAKHVVFAFGVPQSLAQGIEFSTLPISKRHQVAFISRSGYSLMDNS